MNDAALRLWSAVQVQ